MGTDHASMGAIAGVVTLPAHHGLVWDVAWVSAWTVAALWPDFDQAGSTASRTWGGLTWFASSSLDDLVGGHRWGTHDVVLAPLALKFVMVPLLMAFPAGRYVLVALLLGMVMRVMLPRGTVSDLSNLLVSVVGSWWLVGHHYASVLPLGTILAAGIWVHALGDLLTPGGLPVPVVWIFTKGRIALPLFTTGKAFERLLVAPALSLLLVLLINQRSGDRLMPFLPNLLPAGAMPLPWIG